jgi:hypothetical protein
VAGTVTTSNPTCPVTGNEVTTGQFLYDITDSQSTFTLSMFSSANAIETIHEYTVKATAEGGATETVSGTTDVRSVCLASLVNTNTMHYPTFERHYTYELPVTGTDPKTFPTASTDYVTVPTPPDSLTISDYLPSGVSCTQVFSYEMTDGSDAPSELTIDAATGIFTLDNDATIKTTYEVNILITTTDGYNPVELTVDQVMINKVCGPTSTTLTAPTPILAKQIPNYGTLLEVTDSFESANPNCPVTSYTLGSGLT